MSEIIEKWIQFRLGILINKNPMIFAKSLRDGVLIGKILYCHGVIVYEELSTIEYAEDECVMRDNFKYVKNWLHAIGVDCDDECVSKIISCDPMEAFRLLYNIYLNLLDKTCVQLATLKLIKSQMIFVTASRFKVTKVPEENLYVPTAKSDYSKYIEDNQHIINWKRVRKEVLQKRCKQRWEAYLKYLESKIEQKTQVESQKMGSSFIFLCSTSEAQVDTTYGKLQNDLNRIELLGPFVPLKTKSLRIVQSIQERNTATEKENSLKDQLTNHFLLEASNRLDMACIREFEECVKHKVLLQSFCEQQMTGLMVNVKELTNTMVSEHSATVERMLDKETERTNLMLENSKKDACEQRKNILLLEQQRKIELQKRLSEEQKAVESRRNQSLCRDIIDNLVNVAIRHGEYSEKYGRPALWRLTRMWLFLAVKAQSAFDILDSIPDIVCYDYNKDIDEELSEKMLREIERQNICDQAYLEAFCDMEYRFSNLCGEGICDFDLIAKRNNILGFVVFRLLLSKYPKPPLPSTEDLPPFTLAASIVGINNLQFIPILQQMLLAQNVKVIQLGEAIDFCLSAYKEEYDDEFVQQTFIETSAETLKDLDDKITGIKKKSKNRWKKGEMFTDRRKLVLAKVSEESLYLQASSQKTTQTPDVFPCNEVILTKQAQLGKYAFEILNIGEQLPQRLLTEIFIEYLKSLKNIKGWVLVNYPRTMEEAVLLEEALTGKECLFDHSLLEDYPCIEDLADLELRTINIYPEYDPNKKFRKSILVPNPIPIEPNKYYVSYLTSYIVLMQESNTKEKAKDLAQFYMDKGTYYLFKYEKLDFHALKQLGKLIFREASSKPSLEVFGETISVLQNNIPEDVRRFPRIEKKGKKLNPPKEIQLEDVTSETDKATQEPELEDEYIITTKSKVFPKPGEPNWNYVSLPIPEALAETLATIWETLEETYKINQSDWLFIHRMCLDNDYPILYYREQLLQQYSCYPANKQFFMDEFQKLYNAISDDMRDDVETKAEIHYRIEKLRQNLLGIIDENMQKALDMWNFFLKDFWLSKFLYRVLHNYTYCLQLETDLHMKVVQFLTDYYSAMVTKKLRPNISHEDLHLETDPAYDSLEFQEFYNSVLNFINSEDVYEEKSINNLIKKNYHACLDCLEKSKVSCDNVLAEVETDLQNLDSHKKSTKNVSASDSETEEQWQALLDEWKYVINGDHNKIKCGLNIIYRRCEDTINTTINKHKQSIIDSMNMIREQNKKEKEQIDEICWVLSMATEYETKLQPRFVLEGQKFHVQPDIITYLDPVEENLASNSESLTELLFTVDHLNNMADILLKVAPKFIVLERNFAFLLQDLIVHQIEDGEGTKLSPIWSYIETRHVSAFTEKLFGSSDYVDWREFIIQNLNLKFPSETELLETRRMFKELDPDSTEIVLSYQFFSVEFWFEHKTTASEKNLKKIKQLLAKLYRVKEDSVNYTRLLLALCKDEYHVLGIAKAFELSLGKYVCWDEMEGIKYIEHVKEERRKRKEHKQTTEMVQQLLKDVIRENTESNDMSDLNSVEEEASSSTSLFTECSDDTEIVYFLSYHTMVVVLVSSLPCILKTNNLNQCNIKQMLQQIYLESRNSEFGERVFVHEFLHHKNLNNLLIYNQRFIEKKPATILNKILNT